jgi:penicillin-binding protein 1A
MPGKLKHIVLTLIMSFFKWLRWLFRLMVTPKPNPVTPTYYAILCWKYCFVMFLGIFLFVKAVEHNFLFLFGNIPSVEALERPKLNTASEIYSIDGVLLGKYYKENRTPTEFNKISPYVIKALLATEDIRFADHSGIDFEASLSILYYLAKGDNRGGSTITQQLAKNLFKTRKKEQVHGLLGTIPGVKTVIIKLKEWITAVKLERHYTKKEILNMYLNTVDFGSNAFGIKTASKIYFSTTPSLLKIEEAALLVGMLKATTSYNPRRNPKRAKERRNTVLYQMLKYDFITQAAYDSLSALPITLQISQTAHPDGVLDYYGPYVTEVLNAWADDQGYDIYTDGLKIYLTIDSRMQTMAQEAMQEHMRNQQRRFNEHWAGKNPWIDERGNEIPNFLENAVKRTQAYKGLKKRFGDNEDSIQYYLNKPKKMEIFSWKGVDSVMWSTMDSLNYYKRMLRAGFLAMEHQTGAIKTWVGGIDYKFFKYDHVKQAVRQPGSTFKAFVYALAMEKGYSPCYRMQDTPVTIRYEEDSAGVLLKKIWSPGNATGYFSGVNMTLRFAMGRSINSIAAKLTQELTPAAVADFAHKCGIKSPLKPIPSIGLGSNDVSLFEMVNAYCTFPNSGFYIEPMIVSRIEDAKGNLIIQFQPKVQKVMTEEAAYNMVHMLKGTIQEPGGTAQALWSYRIFRGNEIGGKTGTSNNQSDGWFIGLTKDLVGGVWVGAEDRSVHFRTLRTGEGSKTALPLFGIFMEKLYAKPEIGYAPGFFPKKNFRIGHCPTAMPKKDTTDTTEHPGEPDPDELLID